MVIKNGICVNREKKIIIKKKKNFHQFEKLQN